MPIVAVVVYSLSHEIAGALGGAAALYGGAVCRIRRGGPQLAFSAARRRLREGFSPPSSLRRYCKITMACLGRPESCSRRAAQGAQ
jgi:hypothetical protein